MRDALRRELSSTRVGIMQFRESAMIASVHLLEDFFRANVPSVQTLLLAGPPALLWAAFCLHLAGHMKASCGWKTGYTRKIFHFLIFGTVVAVHRIWGLPGVCLFGGMTSLVLAFALWRGLGHPWYEALAREKDAPRRTHYVVVPYAATLLGGLAVNIFFPDTAVFGYLVTGLGDAVAEPVGTRFGRRLYRVPAMTGVHAVRSLEGSAAVFLASALSLTAWLGFSPGFSFSSYCWSVLAVALAATVVEALSPHGWDNFTLQVVPAWLGSVLF